MKAKRNKIILMVLHIICAVMFAANAAINFTNGYNVAGIFAVIASVCWTGCTVIDILGLKKFKN